ncbi:MAG: hypothetical protein R2863_07365 [Candidatus Kapaibacterium sp.]
MISPANSLGADVIIAFARVSSAGNVEVRFRNFDAGSIDFNVMDFFITVIK